MYKFLFLFCLLIPYKLKSQFEFGVNYTSGIVRTYNSILPSASKAPSFKSFNLSKYSWGILFDFKVYKNLYVSIGTEHKDMHTKVNQSFYPSESTQDRFGVTELGVGHGSSWGYWSFPLRISYNQKLYKGIFISPNIGISYLYNVELNYMLSQGNSVVAINDTQIFLYGLNEKEYTNLNVHLFQFQIGAEIGWKHKFFSVYLGVNYSKGLNKMFVYKLESTEKDLYVNTPVVHYSETLESRGSNLNSYLGMRFQLYPIIKAKKKIPLE